MRRAVLITRPEPDGGALAAQLVSQGYDARSAPLFETVLNTVPPESSDIGAVMATSRNALRAFQNIAAPDILHLPFFAVGEETAEAATAAGFRDVRIAKGNAASLADDIIAAPPAQRLLYLAGAKRKDVLETKLFESGFHVTVWEGYDMRALAFQPDISEALTQRHVAAVLLFSERAAQRFIRLVAPMGQIVTNTPDYLCLSKDIAAPLQERGLRAFAPFEPNLNGVLGLLAQKNIG